MKLVLLTLETKKESWVEDSIVSYKEKIKRFVEIEVIKVKSPSIDRDNQAEKVNRETELLLKNIKPDDFVVLLDEKGEQLDSLSFSKTLVKCLESGKKRVVFVIGGAFGVSDKIREASNLKISLSKLTMNHLVAQTVLLEQIYRGLTIYKGIPYHNG